MGIFSITRTTELTQLVSLSSSSPHILNFSKTFDLSPLSPPISLFLEAANVFCAGRTGKAQRRLILSLTFQYAQQRCLLPRAEIFLWCNAAGKCGDEVAVFVVSVWCGRAVGVGVDDVLGNEGEFCEEGAVPSATFVNTVHPCYREA